MSDDHETSNGNCNGKGHVHTSGHGDGERPPRRPDGVDDTTVEAVGKLSEALEYVERARGHLYSFHQLMGHADAVFGEAADALAAAGHHAVADRVRHEVVGRDVLEGRWTFQVVEEYDDGYYHPVSMVEQAVVDQLMAGRRHVHESELKAARHQPGQPGPTPAQA